mmetsp:Transcript_54178/g.104727  ORF Transcript_54178/g.104727 Transcript_54178/m.104727 type:complete len:83 (+) Transcript_54178:887-1135(+)
MASLRLQRRLCGVFTLPREALVREQTQLVLPSCRAWLQHIGNATEPNASSQLIACSSHPCLHDTMHALGPDGKLRIPISMGC